MASMFSDVGRLLEIEILKIAKNPKESRFEAEAFGYSDATVSRYLSEVKLPKFVIDAIKLADYRDIEVISALNSLQPDDALTAFDKIAG